MYMGYLPNEKSVYNALGLMISCFGVDGLIRITLALHDGCNESYPYEPMPSPVSIPSPPWVGVLSAFLGLHPGPPS